MKYYPLLCILVLQVLFSCEKWSLELPETDSCYTFFKSNDLANLYCFEDESDSTNFQNYNVHPYKVVQTDDGGYLVFGNYIYDNQFPFLAKFNEQGELATSCQDYQFGTFPWRPDYEISKPQDLTIREDGVSVALISRIRQYEIVELDINGMVISTHLLPDNNNPLATYPNGYNLKKIIERKDAAGSSIGYALVGSKRENNIDRGWLLLLDENFTVIESKDRSYGVEGTWFTDVTQTEDGGFACIGFSNWQKFLTGSSSLRADLSFMHIDSNMVLRDSLHEIRHITYTTHDEYNVFTRMSVQPLSNDRFLVMATGDIDNINFDGFPFFLEIDINGNILSNTQNNDFNQDLPGDAYPQDCIPLGNDEFAIVGFYENQQDRAIDRLFLSKLNVKPNIGIQIGQTSTYIEERITDQIPQLDSVARGWDLTIDTNCGGFFIVGEWNMKVNAGADLLIMQVNSNGTLIF